MPAQVLTSVENNFTKGLVTEFTGLNFPENAATDADNCEFTLIGDVNRRFGIDYEVNKTVQTVTAGVGSSEYKWNNVGGDGVTQIVVKQVGGVVYFFQSSNATVSAPLSTTKLSSVVNLATFTVTTFDSSLECQYADGNGYLFIYHPNCDPIYCTYTAGVITANKITVKVRDFIGVPEPGVLDTFRPVGLFTAHHYNLLNQGWTLGNAWSATSSTLQTVSLGAHLFVVASGIAGLTVGNLVTISGGFGGIVDYGTVASGTVTIYSGTQLTIDITSVRPDMVGANLDSWTFTPTNSGLINTWVTALGNVPSNGDIWWTFKNASGVFDPTTTQGNVTLNAGPAPRGHYILEAFNQQRTQASGLTGLTDIDTTVRPRTGAWFQGRVWYTGVDASQPAAGAPGSSFISDFYTWTENIYFSQIVKTVADLGKCHQANDPTSETLFDLLPTDGGVITIQGCGSIYKLFPIQNGMLVFAANGIWFITGSQGIGFSANDYTITKLSSVKSISSTSFVDVNGLPFFWNEEGIYTVEPSKGGGLTVTPITVGTILEFYNSIPRSSKQYVRGAYHPIDYVVQWVYRSTQEPTSADRYKFDKILNFNTYNKAFYPYSISNTSKHISGIVYVSYPGGSNTPEPSFKYPASNLSTELTFADEHDENYIDWGDTDYTSYFVTGFKLHGQGQRRFQASYIYIYSRADDPTSYYIQGLWDYAKSGNSGRWSVAQLVNNWSPNFGMIFRRHKIRGQGLVLQLKVSSLSGKPFDIMGWSSFEQQNAGV